MDDYTWVFRAGGEKLTAVTQNNEVEAAWVNKIKKLVVKKLSNELKCFLQSQKGALVSVTTGGRPSHIVVSGIAIDFQETQVWLSSGRGYLENSLCLLTRESLLES